MYSVGHAQLPYIHRGDYASASALADELIALADEKGALLWKAVGMLNQGLLFALNGEAKDAVPKIMSGLAAWRATGSTLWAPLYLSHLARAHAELGQSGDAWRCVKEAMTAVETSKERWCEADVHRIAGDIALMAREPDATIAQACFDRALTLARKKQAKSFELRAAMSMARLGARSARPGPWMVHRRLRHARSEGGQGVARRAGVMERRAWRDEFVPASLALAAPNEGGGRNARNDRRLSLRPSSLFGEPRTLHSSGSQDRVRGHRLSAVAEDGDGAVVVPVVQDRA